MNKHATVILAMALLPLGAAAQTPLMRNVFASMPDSILPTVTRNNRLDCIDFIENGMEAKVRGAFDEFVTLEALTPDYLRFSTSPSAYIEMRLLPFSPKDSTAYSLFTSSLSASSLSFSDTDTLSLISSSLYTSTPSLICFVSTVVSGMDSLRIADSEVRFFTTDWQPLPANSFLTMPPVPAFCTGAVTSAAMVPLAKAAQRSLMDFHPIHAALSSDAPTLTLSLQTADLSIDERQAARQLVQTIVMEWSGASWIR